MTPINDLFRLSPSQAKILYALHKRPLITGSNISSLSKIRRSSVYNHLQRLCDMDYIKKVGYMYDLTELGNAAMIALVTFKEKRDELKRGNAINIQPAHRSAESNLVGGG